MDNALKSTAKILVSRFKAEGIVVQRYDAYSTNSIYLKLDYGVANSIRISDHPGKKYLSYRYNIIKGLKKVYSSKDFKDGKTFDRFYYPLDEIERLIHDTLDERRYRMNRYGLSNYAEYMARNKAKEGVEKGFWSQAKVV